MRILLCASKTPDTTAKISFTADLKALENNGVTFILNPYDDHGLAKAMDLKEATNGHLTVVHVGDATSEPMLRKCLAVGADEVIHINAEPTDAFFVSHQITEAIKADAPYDLVITGRESIDFNGSALCDILGEMLGMPSVSFATHIEKTDSGFMAKRFVDGGEETLNVAGAIVISATKELAEPRIPNMRGIMGARTKPIREVAPVAHTALVETVQFEAPLPKKGVTMIDASEAEKLIDILHREEKLF